MLDSQMIHIDNAPNFEQWCLTDDKSVGASFNNMDAL